MRSTPKWRAGLIASVVIMGGANSATAGFIGMARQFGAEVKRISISHYTLAPMAFTQFCLRYRDQCKPKPILFRGGPVNLTAERWEELQLVNRRVNAAIVPEPNLEGLAGEKWLIAPERGDCNDYAVTKRAELLKRGWPAHALLLSEVVVPSGEHHLIVVVRTSKGDLLLDNLASTIRPWAKVPYRWVRIQSPNNPLDWAVLANRVA